MQDKETKTVALLGNLRAELEKITTEKLRLEQKEEEHRFLNDTLLEENQVLRMRFSELEKQYGEILNESKMVKRFSALSDRRESWQTRNQEILAIKESEVTELRFNNDVLKETIDRMSKELITYKK